MKKLLLLLACVALFTSACVTTQPTSVGTTITSITAGGNSVCVDGVLHFKSANVDSVLNAVKEIIKFGKLTTDSTGTHHAPFHLCTPTLIK